MKHDKKLVRFYLPLEPEDPEKSIWSVLRIPPKTKEGSEEEKRQVGGGERITTHLRGIADSNPLLKGIIDRVDFNATTHGQRDLDDDRLSNLIEAISAKRLGLNDVEADIIGRSYEYLIRKFAEGSGQSAGEFYTPAEVGIVMAHIMDPEPGMDIYDPCCGSAGLLIKCELVLQEKMKDPHPNPLSQERALIFTLARGRERAGVRVVISRASASTVRRTSRAPGLWPI